MSVEENKAIMRRWYEEVLNKGNLAVVDELIATDCVDHNPLAPELPAGLEGVKQGFTMFRTAFPDVRVTVEDMIAEGDKVVSRLTLRGTHKGEFMGIAPAGKQVTVASIDIVRIAGGKMVEHWDVIDELSMMQQLGVVPPPGEPRG
ncbi:MAG: ester cyclase [Thermodesulfobacteriota bacterium]